MNERIKQLLGQAYDEAVPETWTTLSSEQLGRVYEKFAELVVRECAGIYDKIDNGNLHMGTDDYLEALHKTFFGVKE